MSIVTLLFNGLLTAFISNIRTSLQVNVFQQKWETNAPNVYSFLNYELRIS